MSFDHGLLNLPLSKRGDIDAEIDRHKAEQSRAERRESKRRAAQLRADREIARRLVENVSESLVDGIAKRTGKSPKKVMEFLRSEAHWNPANVIRALERKA